MTEDIRDIESRIETEAALKHMWHMLSAIRPVLPIIDMTWIVNRQFEIDVALSILTGRAYTEEMAQRHGKTPDELSSIYADLIKDASK
jgi:hypothetical protein